LGHPFGFAVEHLETSDDFRIGVSQYRKLDLVPLGEILQDRRAIVADSGQFESLRFKSLLRVLQLHELRFAEGSPIGRAEEKKDRALRALQSLVGLFLAELIGLSKRGSVLPDFQANGRRNGRIARRHLLFGGNRKSEETQEKKDASDLHVSLRTRFCLLPMASTLRAKPFSLVAKARKSRSQDPSHLWLLNNHHDPEIV
jgi:hypothetical protein